MQEYFKRVIQPLNDELGESLGIKKVQIKYVPQLVRYEFLSPLETEVATVQLRVYGANASYYRHQARVWSDKKQPLKMVERV